MMNGGLIRLLWLPFSTNGSRKLFCLSCLFASGDLFFRFFFCIFILFYVYFVRLREERFYSTVSFCHPGNMFVQFLLKIVICLLYKFSDGTCHEREFKLQAKVLFLNDL